MEDINGRIAQNARVSEEITRDISQVNNETGDITENSSTVSLNAKELLELAKSLQSMVRQFKV